MIEICEMISETEVMGEIVGAAVLVIDASLKWKERERSVRASGREIRD